MADQALLARARKARFDDLISVSGHPSEDVERFLKSIKNLTKANDKSESHELLETVRGKLIQSAGIWFDNNEASFKKWSDFDEIVNLGREIDPQMSDPMTIRYLISGLNPDFQKELSRRESAMNTLDKFLNYVKIEQDLQDIFEKFHTSSINSQQPYFDYNRPSNPTLTHSRRWSSPVGPTIF